MKYFQGSYNSYLSRPPIFVCVKAPLPFVSQCASTFFYTWVLSAPNRAIWLRLRFVIQSANRKSLAIWDCVNLIRKAHCSDVLYEKIGIAILTVIWTEVQITNRAIWNCDLSCPRQRFRGNSCDLGYEADYPLEAPEQRKKQSHSKVGQK